MQQQHQQHQEDYASDASHDEQYFESYADLNVHKVMLGDRPRMDFYRTLLTNPAVVAGKVVVDVGSGSGILSCWAAQSGAAHVFSIEASSLAALQPQILADNELGDRVTVLPSTVEEIVDRGTAAFLEAHACVREHGGVALIVSEWMGFYLFHECMLPSVIRARDFFSEINSALSSQLEVCMLPSCGRLLAAPISLTPHYEENFANVWEAVDGVCLKALGRLEFDEHVEATSPLVEVLPARCLLHDGAVFWEGDLNTVTVDALATVAAARRFHFAACPARAQPHLHAAGRLTVDGFAVWFEVSHGPTVLDTSPCAPPTHWKQTTVLLPRAVRDAAVVSFDSLDESLELTLTLSAQDTARRTYTLEFELN